MKKLSTRIMLGYVYTTSSLVVLIIFFSFQTIKQNYYQSSIRELIIINKSLQLLLQSSLDSNLTKNINNDYNFNNYVTRIGKHVNTRITIIAINGKVIADSKENPQIMDNHINRPEVFSAISGLKGQDTRYSKTLNKEMLYVALPLYKNNSIKNQKIGVLRTSFLLKDVDILLIDLTIEIAKISILVILFSMFMVIVFTKKIVKPLNQLSFATRNIASGDFDINLQIQGYVEIVELTNNFNNMTKKLKKLFHKVNIQKEKLRALVSNVQEGIVVVNIKDEITLFNDSFQNISKENKINRHDIKLIINEQNFINLLNDVKNLQKGHSTEIFFNDFYYFVSANFIDFKQEIIFVFTNITELKNIEVYKRDLVANASHELRTPLTAIKGFIETMEEEAEGDIKHYAEIINRHTDRLINLVNDLLTLSELENSNNNLIYNEVVFNDLINNLIMIFENKLKNKNLNLKLEIVKDLIIEIDAFRIEQVLINIIDNAIKYSENGDVQIICKIINPNKYRINNKIVETNYKEMLLISITDNGIGIPDKDKTRIFERFYTVDKSRARILGGTGLGLSIVKHIINLHNGIIFVEDNIPNGTIFNVLLPYKNNKIV
ncbi:MAG: ATP-binding protein [Candidatus Kapaibacteriota bacterium]|jgi:two-component system phosphate regulon sensor histidine kinase PhoR